MDRLTDEQIAQIEKMLRWTKAEDWELVTLGDDAKRLGQFVVKPFVGGVAACPKESPIFSGHSTYMEFIAESGRNLRALINEIKELRTNVAEVERIREYGGRP